MFTSLRGTKPLLLLNFALPIIMRLTRRPNRLGMGGVLVFGAIMQFIAYVLIFWKPPFPLFVAAFFFSGLGVAYQDAQANTFVANMNSAHRWLGLLHALYGAGALVSPLIATSIAAHTPYWNYFYIVLLAFAAIDIGLLAWTFRSSLLKPLARAKDTADKDLKQTLSQRAVWVLSAFFFLYVGCEVTVGGMSLSSAVFLHLLIFIDRLGRGIPHLGA